MNWIHDPLLAVAMVIDNGEKMIAFCSVDHIEIQSAFASFFASFKIPPLPKTARGKFREGMEFEICKKISSKSSEF